MMRFQAAWGRVAAVPVWVHEPFQDWVMRWSPPKLNVITQSVIAALPVLVTVTSATKPLLHRDVLVNVPRQDRAGGFGLDETGGPELFGGGGLEPPVTVTALDAIETLPAASLAR